MHQHTHYHYHNSETAPVWAVELKQQGALILSQLEKIMTVQSDIAAALAKVQADVTAQTTVEAGVATFIQGLQAQLAALAGQTTDTTTAAALTALSTQIETNTSGLSTAITAGTPAA